jgi:hypothetical protein
MCHMAQPDVAVSLGYGHFVQSLLIRKHRLPVVGAWFVDQHQGTKLENWGEFAVYKTEGPPRRSVENLTGISCHRQQWGCVGNS